MSGWLLALESGGDMSSAALIHPSGELHVAQTESGQSHSSGLLPIAQSLLSKPGIAWRDLDGIAVGAGPGSFTGLRIACGIAQGLSLGAGSKLLAVSGFEAWAYAWWSTHGRVLPQEFEMSFDARLGERFAAGLRFERDTAASEAAENSHANAHTNALAPVRVSWQKSPAVVAASECDVSGPLADPTPDSIGAPGLPLAAWIARYAMDPAFAHGHAWGGAADLRPLYVRDKVAQTLQERQTISDLQWAEMTERDLASVMVIENQAYPFPWTAGNFLDSMKAGYTLRVLKERGVMIGYLVWMRVLDEIHLLNIALSPARQGRGLGAWMMRQFIAQASEGHAVFLEVRPSNASAIRLYRRMGFQEIGLRKGYYPNSAMSGQTREDAIVMKLDMSQPLHSQSVAHA